MKYLNLLVAALSAAMIGGTAIAADDGAWSYQGATGPASWGGLDARYEPCKAGLMQSPIELDQANAVADLPVSVDYRPGTLQIANKGKTVQANFAPGSYMTSSGKVFSLVQVHFHTPSEHRINGNTYPLVAHFVHATQSGELGVLGILYEEGDANGELDKIISAAKDAGADAQAVDGVMLDAERLLPDELEVYRYMGSLTTPPCSEGVNWHVAEDTVEASASQIQEMQRLMGNNARPIQPINSRLLVAPE